DDSDPASDDDSDPDSDDDSDDDSHHDSDDDSDHYNTLCFQFFGDVDKYAIYF
ncbi:hypothetical protein Tco_0690880, partial [Tanacetum coccineum]